MADYIEELKEAGYQPSWFKEPEHWKKEVRLHESVCRQLHEGRHKAVTTGNLITELAQSHQIEAARLINEVRSGANCDRRGFLASKIWCARAGWYHNLSELDYLERTGFYERARAPDAGYCWKVWQP